MQTEMSKEVITITTFQEYQAEALKTASMDKGRTIEGFVRVCGLVGEAAELREELMNIGTERRRTDALMKELGDVLWYAATLAEWFGLGVLFDFTTIQLAANRCRFDIGYAEILCVRAAKLAELMKKHLGHDKPMVDFNGKELELMQDVFMAIAHVANVAGLPLSRVAAVNINKLRARYQGGGFTTTLANAHVDERTQVEGMFPPGGAVELVTVPAPESIQKTWESREAMLADCAAHAETGYGPLPK